MLKDILVHLDGSADDELKLQHAEAIATASQGHLTGLFTNPLADLIAVMPLDGGAAAAQVMTDLDEEFAPARKYHPAAPGGAFLAALGAGTPGQLADRAASEARWADLFVASRPYAIRASLGMAISARRRPQPRSLNGPSGSGTPSSPAPRAWPRQAPIRGLANGHTRP